MTSTMDPLESILNNRNHITKKYLAAISGSPALMRLVFPFVSPEPYRAEPSKAFPAHLPAGDVIVREHVGKRRSCERDIATEGERYHIVERLQRVCRYHHAQMVAEILIIFTLRIASGSRATIHSISSIACVIEIIA